MRLSIPRTTQVVELGTGPIVSIASHGKRISGVHLTIESIGRGTLLPSRIILNLSENEECLVGRNLKKLQLRGLEINYVQDLGPHKKWYFADVRELQGAPFVTADDDVFYPNEWLAELSAAWHVTKSSVVANQVDTMCLHGASPNLRYKDSDECGAREKKFCFDIAVGGRGVAYPPEFISYLQGIGQTFMNLAPKQDDIWLSMNAWFRSIRVQKIQLSREPIDNYFSTYSTPLYKINRLPTGNQRALHRVYSHLISSAEGGK